VAADAGQISWCMEACTDRAVDAREKLMQTLREDFEHST
jgi:hypothetical protein